MGWTVWVVVGTGMEMYALRKGHREHTLSHVTRSLCRTETRLGRMAFVGGWVGFSLWWVRHVVLSPHNNEGVR